MKQDYTCVENIYIVCGETDMRKGMDGLATLIQDSFELDPYSDSIFYSQAEARIDINVCILMETVSPCCISDSIVGNSNGRKMN